MKIYFPLFLFLIITAANHAASAQKIRPDEITEIVMETGDGFCADCERITRLSRDGTASYQGGKNSRVRKGGFSGKISPADFKKLAKIITEAGFFELKPCYEGKTSDAATTKITIKYAGGRQKTVEDFGASPEPKLKTVERAFNRTAGKIVWQTIDEPER